MPQASDVNRVMFSIISFNIANFKFHLNPTIFLLLSLERYSFHMNILLVHHVFIGKKELDVIQKKIKECKGKEKK